METSEDEKCGYKWRFKHIFANKYNFVIEKVKCVNFQYLPKLEKRSSQIEPKKVKLDPNWVLRTCAPWRMSFETSKWDSGCSIPQVQLELRWPNP